MTRLHQISGKRRYGAGLAFISVIFWGILPIVLKVLIERIDVFTIVWFRFLGAAVIISLFIVRRYGIAPLFKIRGVVILLTIVTILGLGGNYVTYALGVKYMSPGMAVVMIQISPMLLILGGLVLFRERFNPVQWIGLGVLLGGLILFFHDRIGEIFSGINNLSIGLIVIMISALVWAIYAMAQKQLLRFFPSEIVMARIYIGGMILFFPLAHPERILDLDPVRIGLLVFSSINTVIAYGCFSEALEHLEVSRIGLIVAITPLITLGAAAAAALLFPEYLSPENLDYLSIIGACLVVMGSMLGSFSPSPVIQSEEG
jgi:drug/metabolite transporter (DMT)-like permease